MSRLAFGPKPREMEVTDISTGHFVFTPVEGQRVSLQALEEAIENAGYEIEGTAIEVAGTVTENRHLETPDGQLFHLTAVDEDLKSRLLAIEPGTDLAVQGAWQVREGAEVVVVQALDDDDAEDGGSERPG